MAVKKVPKKCPVCDKKGKKFNANFKKEELIVSCDNCGYKRLPGEKNASY